MEKFFILLAEDDVDDQMFFGEAIKQLSLNIEMKIVENGEELLSFLIDPDTEMPDLIFLDLNMPGKGGIESLIEIRKNNSAKDISIAIYSTSDSYLDMEECLVKGANIYIKKPTDIETLKSLLYKVITINHQYDGSDLCKENFLMVV